MLGFRPDFDEKNRIIKQEFVEFDGNRYFVSTVDLGLDHGFGGVPLYWETMIFPANNNDVESLGDLYCERYGSKGEALNWHEEIVGKINNKSAEFKDGRFIFD